MAFLNLETTGQSRVREGERIIRESRVCSDRIPMKISWLTISELSAEVHLVMDGARPICHERPAIYESDGEPRREA